MSDPFKDRRIQKDREQRRKTHEEYTPVVIWLSCDMVETGESQYDAEEVIRRELRDVAKDMPFVSVSTNEPKSMVLTEFDEETEV